MKGEEGFTWFEDYDYDSDDFTALGRDYEKQGDVITGNAENAVCRLFDLKAGVNFAQKMVKGKQIWRK